MVMPFTICTVGCGWIADAMHGPAFLKYRAANPEAVFAGCCDIDAARAEGFRAKYAFRNAYTDMGEMLAREKPDAVCLLSSVATTAALAAQILEMGIPLLLEKPPGRTLEEASRLLDIAERKSVPNRVAFNRRYAPLIRKTKELLDAEFSPGQIQSLQYDMFRIGRLDEDFSTTAIHAIDTARFLAGADYGSLHITYRGDPALCRNVTDFHMICTMKSGAVVKLNICPVTGTNREAATVNLHDNTLFLDYMGNPVHPMGRLTALKKNTVTLDITAGDLADGVEPFERDGFYEENRSFFDDVIAGKTPSGDLSTTLQSVEVADCLRRRMREFSLP